MAQGGNNGGHTTEFSNGENLGNINSTPGMPMSQSDFISISRIENFGLWSKFIKMELLGRNKIGLDDRTYTKVNVSVELRSQEIIIRTSCQTLDGCVVLV
ncbi:MAG: hypothetical protein Q8830_02820 [Candidatus Phytoplasma australasiaticum]|nr:hypothetical protein [Candidatus Phytoplasma australasiaticum]